MSLDPRQLRYKPWILMYALSILSLMACFLIVYLVTKTRDVSFEWMAWIFFGLGILTTVGGYFTERREKAREFNSPKIS
ncbi:hypothetical protein KEJ47_06075 [Candidatus Bathyarchaeota archaeon]|nr:hypothetical protein [Candidatus Bathyarchaeota archaeon]